MAPKRKIRKTRPAIFVFCEGKTEQLYIDMLRTHFRVPIQIITKVLDTKVSQRLIDNYIKTGGYPDADKVFLFYDGDRPDIIKILQGISDVEVILTYPCIELWYLLHFATQSSEITSAEVVKKLCKHYPAYDKAVLQDDLKEMLVSSWEDAASRARKLTYGTNPSTKAYILPEYLKSLKET